MSGGSGIEEETATDITKVRGWLGRGLGGEMEAGRGVGELDGVVLPPPAPPRVLCSHQMKSDYVSNKAATIDYMMKLVTSVN